MADIPRRRFLMGSAGDFLDWLEGFAPVTEREHPYYSSENNYGQPDPAPARHGTVCTVRS